MTSQHSGAKTDNGKIRITYLPTEPTTSNNNVLIRIPASPSSGNDLRQVIGTKRRATIEGPPVSSLSNGFSPANKRPTQQVGHRQLPPGDSNLASRLQTVITKLAASEERVCCLEAELIAAQQEKNGAQCEVSYLRQEQSAQGKKSAELVQILGTLESAIKDLQARNKDLETENEGLKKCANDAETSVTNVKEQNEFLSTRNATLSKKCESLCNENKKLASDHLIASSELADVKPKYEATLKELKVVTELKDKKVAEARTAEESYKRLQREKLDLERRLQMRETLRVEAIRAAEERSAKLLAEKRELEDRLRRVETQLKEDRSSSSSVTTPTNDQDLRADIALLKSTVDSVKKHFESKLEQLSATCQSTTIKTTELSKRVSL